MWYLDGVAIVVTGRETSNGQIIARLQPLASGTVHHIFGYEDKTSKITGLVVGSGDKGALEAFTKDAETHSLSSTDGITSLGYGSYLVKSATFTMQPVIKQSIRTDLPCDSPVYEVAMELYESY